MSIMGVVKHLRMRIVHDIVKFPPPLIALHLPLGYHSLLNYHKLLVSTRMDHIIIHIGCNNN